MTSSLSRALSAFALLAYLGVVGCGKWPASPDRPESVAQHTTFEERLSQYEHPTGAPPLGRPANPEERRILAIDDDAERAREAIKAHKLSIAEQIVYQLGVDTNGSPKWDAIRRDLLAAEQQEMTPAIQSDFPEKVDQWLKEIAAAPEGAPSTIDELRERERFFEVMAQNLDGDRALNDAGNVSRETPAMAAARAKLRAALAAKQIGAFPVLRRAFVKLSADRMWANDVYVRAVGARIVYTGGVFSANSNVAAAEEAVEADLKKLRFKSVGYEWYKGSQSWVYELNSPADGSVVLWNASSFEPVK